MRSADQVLSIIHERGQRGLPLERVYRLLFNPALYLKAYGKIYRNDGALTKGTTEETVDGMSMPKIAAIIEALRDERYHWTPVRRIYIEKRHSKKKRPLGLPICLSYCLSFQAMLGIPMVANGVDQKSQPTLFVLLYHVLLGLSTPTAFPVPLRRLAQLRDDFWGEGNPTRAMRVSAHTLQNPGVTPIGNRRDVDIEQFRGRQGGIAPVASLSSWAEPRTLRASEGNMVRRANPVDFAGRKAAAQPRTQALLIEQVRDLTGGMGWSQFPHPGNDLLISLTDFPGFFEARDGQARACFGLPANVDHDALVAFGQRDILNQPAQQLFTLGKGSRWGIPERRQVLGQRADLLPLLRRQGQRSRFRHDLIGSFQAIDLQQFLIPFAFQAACDQSIVGIDGTIAPASQVRFILRTFDLSPCLLIDLFGTCFQLGQRCERNFQSSRFDGFQKTRT